MEMVVSVEEEQLGRCVPQSGATRVTTEMIQTEGVVVARCHGELR